MNHKIFNGGVILAVMLTGAGFGTLTGLAYEPDIWWAGTIAGTVVSGPLAIVYLAMLKRISVKPYSRAMMWFLGTLTAMACGLLCTTVVHGVMLPFVYHPEKTLLRQMDGFWLLVLLIGELVGAAAGLIVGGISSLVYVLSIKNKRNETA